MSFDRDTLLDLIQVHGPVVRVVVAQVAGSTPREVGAAMVVWADGQSGTIGGGALEFEAATLARAMLESGRKQSLQKIPLGPARGQCCGGSVSLLSEAYDEAALAETGAIVARSVSGDTVMPLRVQKLLAQMRNGTTPLAPQLLDGWMVEPLANPSRPIWVWGAGHVGRAIVQVMAPLPDFAVTWVDTGADRFPADIPKGVNQLVAAKPADVVRFAPRNAEHLILTYSHPLDLELCHQVLHHGFSFAGVIGSATKWARFRKRLRDLGHSEAQISRICCPIGQPELGKHPQAIAVGVTSELLKGQPEQTTGELPGDSAVET
ncbi:xanthine dehydrogenase accessory protein XdhC [Actibacterium pelagium]|uniref:Xanthine dehydrogenase accessory protein XdhC n=1 Tax=Actibacterium pelagium TaxID=2029103 RepID=A0A917AKL2_9RHOB|nr:xanthine dehydrogenase accessory protein XdhC [Actibacterium pelagium]GGE56092.1 xanthine dehydrogenase accessory protein XdhC [Actibacterium pelagium]